MILADKILLMENLDSNDLLETQTSSHLKTAFLLGIISVCFLIITFITFYIDIAFISTASALISFVSTIVGLSRLSKYKNQFDNISKSDIEKSKIAKTLLIFGLIVSSLYFLFLLGVLILIGLGGFSR